MRYEAVLAAALAGSATAHSIAGLPQILGNRKVEASMRKVQEAVKRSRVSGPAPEPLKREVKARQNPTRCGPGVGNCAPGDCCSSEGWCGVGKEYCAAPDCQQNYGPACDSNSKPSGADTSGVARPHVGSVTYNGAGIYSCVNTGDIAITFDDGPYLYTSDLLDMLDSYNAKATFFITGNNLGKGKINDASTGYPDLIRRMHNSSHQIGSHTWSHQNSSQTSASQWTEQMVWNEIALNDILGFFPTYMRPPYSICESQCQSILSTLGYHITYFDLDTEGYLHNDPNTIGQSKAILDAALASSSPSSRSWLQIEHDIDQVVVYELIPYVLQQLQADGWNMVTVGTCLGDPTQNWYRSINGLPGGGDGGLEVSTDGTCGNGKTCQGSSFGDCCSPAGWCGSTEAYCGTGCQPTFGTCPGSGLEVSTDGTCGNGKTCQGSSFGNCCSQYGWCGSSTDHCGTGCQTPFGTCSGTSLPVSTDGTCGDGKTCQGSSFGNCCSQYGWCGSSTDHCGAGCQSPFGTCS